MNILPCLSGRELGATIPGDGASTVDKVDSSFEQLLDALNPADANTAALDCMLDTLADELEDDPVTEQDLVVADTAPLDHIGPTPKAGEAKIADISVVQTQCAEQSEDVATPPVPRSDQAELVDPSIPDALPTQNARHNASLRAAMTEPPDSPAIGQDVAKSPGQMQQPSPSLNEPDGPQFRDAADTFSDATPELVTKSDIEADPQMQASVTLHGTVNGADGAPPVVPAILNRARAFAPVTRQLAEQLPPAAEGVVEVILAPEELGRIRMLISPGDTLSITIHAERTEVMGFLRRNMADLQDELTKAGFPGADISFSDHERGDGQEQAPPSFPTAAAALTEGHSNGPSQPEEPKFKRIVF